MTPGARIASAIDLLEAVAADPRPADRVANGFFRARRYMGSKDRRAVAELAYQVLRRRARLDWWIGRAAPGSESERARVLALLTLTSERDISGIAGLFDGTGYHPKPLTTAEKALVKALTGEKLEHPEQPLWVRGEVPEWLLPALSETLGDDLAAELEALAGEAPIDLRVNRLKADRDQAVAALAAEGLAAEPTPLSPIGLRLTGRRALTAGRAYRDGLVEIQDEGSQIVALLTDARPAMTVADLCAGAGGKTLALAATMDNSGRLYALDLDAARLGRSGSRIARAGARNVVLHVLLSTEDPVLSDLSGTCERVLVDAPCAGAGAWRRNPDARWRLDPQALSHFTEHQDEVLDAGALMVAPGGRLVYATCSLIPEENQRRVESFLARNDDFALLPVGQVWAETLEGPCPTEDAMLQLTPGRHGTDGFFLAILERRGAP
jgi:16S rRNA (cytosine967-C5)-methyltransferase